MRTLKIYGIFILIIVACVVLGGLFIYFNSQINKDVATNKTAETVFIESRLPVFEFVSYRVRVHTFSEIIDEQKALLLFNYGYQMKYEYIGEATIGEKDGSNIKVSRDANGNIIVDVSEVNVGVIDMNKKSFQLVSATSDYLRSFMGAGIPIQDIFDSINLEDNLKTELENDGITIPAARENLINNIKNFYAPFGKEVIIKDKDVVTEEEKKLFD